MSGYFGNFETGEFKFDGQTYILEDLTKRVVFDPTEFSNGIMVEELLLTGERPDQLAHMIYGDSNLWWIVFIVNGITYNDWPLIDNELEEMIKKRHTEWELQQPFGHFNPERVPSFGWKYFVADGKQIDYAFNPDLFKHDNPNFIITESIGERRTLRQQYETINDTKKRIKVLRKEYVGEFVIDFRRRLRSEVDYSLI